MPSVMAVRKSALASMPEPFRRYVEDHFEEKRVLGVDCMVAERHLYNPRRSVSHSLYGWPRGMAPCHSVDLRKHGDVEGKSLSDWIRGAAGDDLVELFFTERSSERWDDD